MKRKIAAFLIFVLSVSLLGGCGGTSEVENETLGSSSADSSMDNSDNSLSDNTSEAFGETVRAESSELSEYLSKEKVIAYEVETVDKEKTPKRVYFFENGKVTILTGSAFGKTMGDFSKMTDEEIWIEFETVKETYKESYLSDTKMDDLDRYLLEYYCKQEDRSYANFHSYEDFQLAPVILEAVRGKTYAEVAGIEPIEVTGSGALNWGDSLGYTAEVCLSSYWNFQYLESQYEFAPLGEYTEEEEKFWSDSDWKEDETVTFSGAIFEDAIAHYKNAIATIENLKTKIKYHGPFYELPFSFVIETDASGNIVANEKLVFPTLEDKLGEAPSTFYEYIKFANVEGADRPIYDTTYHCMGLGKGEAIFCSRDVLTLDTVDSENVLIDLSTDEINELFKEEVTARYE